MDGAGLKRRHPRGAIAPWLVGLALLLRLLVPSGWMPASGQGLAITLCTGAGAVQAWIDDKGVVHKQTSDGKQADHPCLFAGFAALLDLPAFDDTLPAAMPALAAVPPFAVATVAIGRGLAAPPPPSTGPPARL